MNKDTMRTSNLTVGDKETKNTFITLCMLYFFKLKVTVIRDCLKIQEAELSPIRYDFIFPVKYETRSLTEK